MSVPNRAIKRIQVKGLFGMFNYDLKLLKTSDDVEKVLILYGDNGSGKTTILKTVFHLLSPESSEGHKGFVAKVPFKHFEIELMSGDIIWADRTSHSSDGTFEMGLKRLRGKEWTVRFEANKNNKILDQPKQLEIKQIKFLHRLRGLNISLYLLSDDRAVELGGQTPSRKELFDDLSYQERLFDPDNISTHLHRSYSMSKRDLISPEEIAKQLLRDSIKRAFHWIRSQTMLSSSVGESSVNTLYIEILRRITSSHEQQDKLHSKKDSKKMEKRLEDLEARSKKFSQYGLLPTFDGKQIIQAVIQATVAQIGIFDTILNPYIESVEKKLEAMEKVYRHIDAFVRIVNEFLTHKFLTFEIHQGIQIFTKDGNRELSSDSLSSGERHLLLLFCNTLIALDRPSIFIIDEPEISLNIKWQRKLVSSLLECVGENPVQYLFATHSMELLAKHRDKVIRLEDKARGG